MLLLSAQALFQAVHAICFLAVLEVGPLSTKFIFPLKILESSNYFTRKVYHAFQYK